MWSLMQVAKEMGVRIDVPYCELTLGAGYRSAWARRSTFSMCRRIRTMLPSSIYVLQCSKHVKNALSKVKDDKGLARVAKFLKQEACPDCGGSRLSKRARSSLLDGKNLAEATALTLDELSRWLLPIPQACLKHMQPMARAIVLRHKSRSSACSGWGLGT